MTVYLKLRLGVAFAPPRAEQTAKAKRYAKNTIIPSPIQVSI